MDLNDVLVFVKVAQVGSFSQAARQLAMPVSTVSRRIAELEREIGISLLVRTTRSVKVTEVGKAYLQHGLAISSELERAQALASSMQSIPQGPLKITTTTDFGNRFLGAIVSEFLRANPRVQAEVELTERVVDLVGEGFDLAVRIGELSDSGLKARKIGTLDLRLVASPDYLRRRGAPRACDELPEHDCIRFSGEGEPDRWLLEGPKGKLEVKVSGRVVSNNMALIRDFAVAGEGIALMPRFLCADDLKAGRLKPVLKEWVYVSGPVHVVYPAQRFVLPRVRAFIDHLERRVSW